MREWEGQTYYGRRQLKPSPFNDWLVGGYIFLAGLGGAASILAALAEATGTPDGVVRRGRALPMLVPTVGAGLLVWDLHTPSRFYNMLRVAKGTSPMNIGTWVLSGFTVASGASAALHYLGRRRAATAAGVPAAVLGAGMATYTASLLAATSTPLWAAAPRALAARFGSSSMASAAAALSLAERAGGTRRALDIMAALALGVELLAGEAHGAALQRKGIGAARERSLLPSTGAALGMYALSALAGRGSRVAALATVGLSLWARVSALRAGGQSAEQPEISMRLAQPDNLPRR